MDTIAVAVAVTITPMNSLECNQLTLVRTNAKNDMGYSNPSHPPDSDYDCSEVQYVQYCPPSCIHTSWIMSFIQFTAAMYQ